MSWQHLEDKTVKKARKVHKCYLCGETIPARTEYVRRSGVGESGFDVIAMHPECETVSQRWDETSWECFDPGSMRRGVDESR